jgi:hypothetical protein
MSRLNDLYDNISKSEDYKALDQIADLVRNCPDLIRDRSKAFKQYKKCFQGKDIHELFVNNKISKSTDETTAMAERLVNAGILSNLTQSDKIFKCDSNLYCLNIPEAPKELELLSMAEDAQYSQSKQILTRLGDLVQVGELQLITSQRINPVSAILFYKERALFLFRPVPEGQSVYTHCRGAYRITNPKLWRLLYSLDGNYLKLYEKGAKDKPLQNIVMRFATNNTSTGTKNKEDRKAWIEAFQALGVKVKPEAPVSRKPSRAAHSARFSISGMKSFDYILEDKSELYKQLANESVNYEYNEIIAIPVYNDCLKSYMKKQFCSESYAFVNAASAYRLSTDQENSSKLANIIFDTFIRPHARSYVNIDSKTQGNISRNLAESKVTPFLFAEAEYTIRKMLYSDVFRRFLVSEEFLRCIAENNAENSENTANNNTSNNNFNNNPTGLETTPKSTSKDNSPLPTPLLAHSANALTSQFLRRRSFDLIGTEDIYMDLLFLQHKIRQSILMKNEDFSGAFLCQWLIEAGHAKKRLFAGIICQRLLDGRFLQFSERSIATVNADYTMCNIFSDSQGIYYNLVENNSITVSQREEMVEAAANSGGKKLASSFLLKGMNYSRFFGVISSEDSKISVYKNPQQLTAQPFANLKDALTNAANATNSANINASLSSNNNSSINSATTPPFSPQSNHSHTLSFARGLNVAKSPSSTAAVHLSAVRASSISLGSPSRSNRNSFIHSPSKSLHAPLLPGPAHSSSIHRQSINTIPQTIIAPIQTIINGLIEGEKLRVAWVSDADTNNATGNNPNSLPAAFDTSIPNSTTEEEASKQSNRTSISSMGPLAALAVPLLPDSSADTSPGAISDSSPRLDLGGAHRSSQSAFQAFEQNTASPLVAPLSPVSVSSTASSPIIPSPRNIHAPAAAQGSPGGPNTELLGRKLRVHEVRLLFRHDDNGFGSLIWSNLDMESKSRAEFPLNRKMSSGNVLEGGGILSPEALSPTSPTSGLLVRRSSGAGLDKSRLRRLSVNKQEHCIPLHKLKAILYQAVQLTALTNLSQFYAESQGVSCNSCLLYAEDSLNLYCEAESAEQIKDFIIKLLRIMKGEAAISAATTPTGNKSRSNADTAHNRTNSTADSSARASTSDSAAVAVISAQNVSDPASPCSPLSPELVIEAWKDEELPTERQRAQSANIFTPPRSPAFISPSKRSSLIIPGSQPTQLNSIRPINPSHLRTNSGTPRSQSPAAQLQLITQNYGNSLTGEANKSASKVRALISNNTGNSSQNPFDLPSLAGIAPLFVINLAGASGSIYFINESDCYIAYMYIDTVIPLKASYLLRFDDSVLCAAWQRALEQCGVRLKITAQIDEQSHSEDNHAAGVEHSASHNATSPTSTPGNAQSAGSLLDRKYHAYLGGSMQQNAAWRSEIAIPMLTKAKITYYNPVVANRNVDSNVFSTDTRYKTISEVLLFVFDAENRCVNSLIDVVEYVMKQRYVVCVIAPYSGYNSSDEQEIAEINRSREGLREFLSRYPDYVLICDNVESAVQHVIDAIQSGNYENKSSHCAIS